MQLTKTIRALAPERASPDALRINGKSIYDIKQGMSPMEAIKLCEKFIKEDGLKPNQRCIIAHNAEFDKRHIHALWKTYGEIFPADYWIDTMALMRLYNKKNNIQAKVNLVASLETLGIKKVAGGSHNAKSDTRDTYNLWKNLITSLGPVYLEHIKYDSMASDSTEHSEEDV